MLDIAYECDVVAYALHESDGSVVVSVLKAGIYRAKLVVHSWCGKSSGDRIVAVEDVPEVLNYGRDNAGTSSGGDGIYNRVNKMYN